MTCVGCYKNAIEKLKSYAHFFVDSDQLSPLKMSPNETEEFIMQEIQNIKANIDMFYLVIMGLFVFSKHLFYIWFVLV